MANYHFALFNKILIFPIFTKNVWLSPENTYLSVDGNGFNSKVGGCTVDGKILFCCGGNFSNLGVQLPTP